MTEDCANLIGALFAHQNGFVLNQQAKINKIKQIDAERNLDMLALQGEMKEVIDAAETF